MIKETTAIATVKEPWEMTFKEYDSAVFAELDRTFGYTNAATERWIAFEESRKALIGPRSGKEILDAFDKHGKRTEHRWIVEAALREGKPVPATVLRDYPDLVKPEVES